MLGALVYAPTFNFGLVNRDDPWLIANNALLQRPSLDSVLKVLFDFSWEERFRLGAEYLPVRDLSVMLDFAFYGEGYSGHHMTNVIIYSVLCALVVLLLVGWTHRLRLAALAGLLFAMHPVHVEAVAWLSERKGLLGAMFLFAGLHTLRTSLTGSGLQFAGTVALFVLAVLSKAHMVAGVGAGWLLFWFLTEHRLTDRASRRMVVLTVVTLAAFLPAFLTGQQVGMVQPSHGGGVVATAGLFATVHALYLKLMAYVGPYAIVYPVRSAGAIATTVGALTLVAMVGYVAYRAVSRARGDLVAVGLGWWLLFLAPVSHLLFPLQNLMADRYLLVPSLGLLIAVLSPLERALPRVSVAVAVALAAFCALLTFAQVHTWQDSDAMWTQALVSDPTYDVAWEKRAEVALRAGDVERASRLVARGLNAAPNSWRLHHRQGLIFSKAGDPRAVQAFTTAAQHPEADKAQANLALTLLKLGDLEQARHWANVAVKTRDKIAHNQRVLGKVALAQKDYSAACPAFAAALRLDPYSADNHYNLAICAYQAGAFDEARRLLDKAETLDPRVAAQVQKLRDAMKR